MDTLKWQRIQELFHEAADLPANLLDSFLESACPGDEELLQILRSMLIEDAGGASLLDGSLAPLAANILHQSAQQGINPKSFGPYEPGKLIGEGGMGLVYLAKRKDLNQTVAVKVLRDAWLSPMRRDRFKTEQKLLAQLNHPSIARIYDADALADGTPWFAMEYVEGMPITAYCEHHRCGIPRRLQLFLAVCEAVQHAHEQAIIHRDLKPSNILVKGDGSIRLLDFGIARQMESLDTPPIQTQAGLRLMTPAYASPEQVRGGMVGIQADVYSLGVILFELLTGRLPFELENLTPIESFAILTTWDPGKPSHVSRRKQREAGGDFRPQLSNAAWADLDVLCLTAMHRDTGRRYRSVEALKRDIHHYLAQEPLEARPDTLRYRAAKFVRRNRREVAAGVLVLAMIAVLAIFSALRIERARETALAEAARAGRIQSFLLNLFEGGDANTGPSDQLRVVTLLDKGAEEAHALGSDPRVQADLYQTLGDVYDKLGKFGRAQEMFQNALSLRQSEFGAESPEVAETLVALSDLRADQAHFAEAERLAREAVAIDRKKLPSGHPALARAIAQLGVVLEDRGEYEKAIPVLDEAVGIQSRPGGVKADLSSTLTELANSHYYAGHYDTSEDLNKRVLAMDRQLYGEKHPQVADDLINLGAIQLDEGHFDEAAKYDREALDIIRTFYGEDNVETASAMTLLGRALVAGGKDSEAAPLLEKALLIAERVYGPVHPRIASTLNEMGKIALKQGRLELAGADFEREAQIYRQVYGEKHYYLGIALSNLSGVYEKRRQYTEAEKLLREALDIFAQTLPAHHLNVGIARIRLGHALLLQHRKPDAAVETRAGLKIVQTQTTPPAQWLELAQKDLAEETAP